MSVPPIILPPPFDGTDATCPAELVPYGHELLLDLHECDITLFTRAALTRFFAGLCELINMTPEDLHFWDYQDGPGDRSLDPPDLWGTSAVQFIRTSTIVVHCLDNSARVYVNIFSCHKFEARAAARYAAEFFRGAPVRASVMERL